MKKQNLIKLLFSAMMIVSLVSCDKDEEIKSPISKVNTADSGSLVSNSNLIDLGKFVASSTKSALEDERQKVVLTLTNETDTVINELTSVIEFEADFDLDIEMDFKELQPGESMDVTFYYTCLETEPGEYTGVAKLIPNVGEEVVIELKATVVATKEEASSVVLDSYLVDFGTLQVKSMKSTLTEPTETVITLTNETEEDITGIHTSVDFPGMCDIEMDFSKVIKPGESMDIKFIYIPMGLTAGEYTGTATITPNVGEPIIVELKATLEAGDVEIDPDMDFEIDPVTLSSYFLEWGEVKMTAENPQIVTVTVTNNSTEAITSVKSEIDFIGKVEMKYTWETIQPGESADINFEFTPTDVVEAGEYGGMVNIIPNVGDEILVGLSADIVAEEK